MVEVDSRARIASVRLGVHYRDSDRWIRTGAMMLLQKLGKENSGPLKGTVQVYEIPSEEILTRIAKAQLDLGIVAPEIMRVSNKRGFFVCNLQFPGLSRTSTIKAALVSSTPVNPLLLERGPLTPVETFQDQVIAISIGLKQSIRRGSQSIERDCIKNWILKLSSS